MCKAVQTWKKKGVIWLVPFGDNIHVNESKVPMLFVSSTLNESVSSC